MMQSDSKAIAVISQEEVTSIRDLEDRFLLAVRQRELLEAYIKNRLKSGKHFYHVDNSEKNNLTKEGAELICLPHGYKPAYLKLAGPDSPPADNTPFQITVLCRLMRGNTFGGEGIGSASSYITKKDNTYQPRQKDPGLCHNATLKMAQKSAYIAATLNATAASEFFTQDLEDTEVMTGTVARRKEAEDDPRLFCQEHQTPWFKKGKMRAYAHPLKDAKGETVGWCSMPQETPGAASDAMPGPQDGEAPQKADSQGLARGQNTDAADTMPPFTGQTFASLWNWGISIGYKQGKPQCLKALVEAGYIKAADEALIGNLAEAAQVLWEKVPRRPPQETP